MLAAAKANEKLRTLSKIACCRRRPRDLPPLTAERRQIPCEVLKRIFFFFFPCLALALVVSSGDASIIFRPGEKAKYLAPGEEEINGNAQQLLTIAQEAESKGNIRRAIKAYTHIWRKYPKDTLAAGSAYRAGQLMEQEHDYIKAAESYRVVVGRYPGSPHFDEAIEAQFRIGELYLAGKKLKLLGIPLTTSMDRAIEIFAAVVSTAPFGRDTARAQFDIGLARQKQKENEAAIQAFQAVIDKFPNDPIAADAQYQIGYIWAEAARRGTKDAGAVQNARTSFEDYLAKYPKSEKAPQARENLQRLENRATGDAFKVAKFYDKEKAYRAAVIYYNEVIREQPGSSASASARRRIDQIRAKIGEAALQPAIPLNEKKRQIASRGQNGRGGKPAFRSDSEVAPLPPPEQDSALPPPASLAPPTTTAPEPSPTPETTPEPETSPTPESTPATEATPPPAP